MAKIVIDCRMWGESGVGRYVRNLVGNLQEIDVKNEYFLLLLKKDFDQVKVKKNFSKVVADFRWYGVAEQVRLPGIIKKLKPDLVHFPHFNVPVLYKGKFVVTIHDLIHQHFQMRRATTRDPITYRIKHFGYTMAFKNALNKSEKILVPSNYVRDLLVKEWNVSGDKIMVTPEAVDAKLYTAVGSLVQKDIDKVLEKFGVRQPYIYYVGNAHPHKNVEGLIKAFLLLRQKYQYLQLVLSGNDHYFWQKIKREFTQKDIVYTGFVSDEEMVALYKSAKVFVMPSFEEGFGIPLLEAMAIGTPVVSSSAASLSEVGGEAAIYFKPQDVEDLVDKISKVLNSEKLQKELVEKGKKRVKEFSWEKVAEQTLEVYKETE